MNKSRKSFASFRYILFISITLISLVFLGGFFVLGNPDTEELRPNANGTYTEWTVFGASENFAAVNETSPDDDTTYVYTSTTGNRDAYNLTDTTIPGGSTINNVTVFIRARKTGSPGVTIQILTRTSDTDYFSADITLAQSYANYSQNYTNNPNTLASWTIGEINALQVGVKHTTSQAREARVTKVWVEVDYTTLADNPPTATLNSPADNTNQSSASVTFNCTAWDDINLTNVSLYTNTTGSWTLNETNSTPINDTPVTFTKTISDGTYVWNCKAMDNSSNSGWGSSNWTFTIDTQAPVIDDATHSINESLIGLNGVVKLNVSISDNSGSINTTLFNLDGTNYTANDNYPEFYLERTCTVSGTENWQETWANDSVGNPGYNLSVGLSWECDAQAPQVSNLISNDTSPDYNDWIRLNCTINDTEENLNETWIQVDPPMSSAYNTSLTFDTGEIYYHEVQTNDLGEWNFTCYANDTLSQENSTDVYTVTASDQTSPVIDDATHDINVSLAGNDSAINFSVSITDNSGSINTTLFQINNVNYSATDSYPIFYYIDICNETTNGTRSWQKTFANDSAGNSDSNESVGLSYECDAYPPQISNPNANETETVQNKWFCINATVTDANIDTVLAEVWNTTGWLNYTMTDTGSTSCDGGAGDNVFGRDIQGTAIGLWNYSAVYANDTLNQWNSSDFDDITVNVTEAVITLSAELVSISPQSINQGDYSTVTGNCTASGGTANDVYMIARSNQTGSWEDIQTSGQNLTTNVTFYSLGNLNDGQEESRQFNLTSNVPNLYYILIRCNSTNVAADDSSVGTLEVNDTESPVLTSAQRNESLSNGIIKLNISVTDNVAVSAVLFEVNNTNYTQTGNSGDEWYYNWNCSESGSGKYYWNVTHANDTSNNWNSTTEQNLPLWFECDINAPLVENGTNDANGTQQLDTIANITCDVEDPEGNNDTIWLFIDRPGVDTNETMNYQSGNTWNISVTLNETGTWSFTCYANDTVGNVNFTSIPNSNPVFLNVTLNAPTPGEEKSVIQNKTFWINASVKCEGDPSIDCGEVNGTARYNASSSDPDTVIPASGTPFYTADLQPQSCGVLIGGDTCQLNWSVNATGAADSYWSVDANFSSNESISSNDTEDAFVKITSITLTSELISINPISINQGGYSIVTGNCTANGGSVTNAYMIIESNQTGSWEDIQTSGQNLTTNITHYYIGSMNDDQENSSSFNVTSNIPNIYWIMIECNSTETGSGFSSSGSLQVNDSQAPWFGSPSISGNSVGNGQVVNLTQDVYDNVGVDTVYFTIESVNKTANSSTNGTAYYEWICSVSGSYSWTVSYANDTSNNWGSDDITDQTWSCDANPPQVSGMIANDTTPDYNDWIRINCSINDTEENLNETRIQVDPPMSSAYNTSLTFDTGEIYYHEVQTNELGEWNFTCYANDTFGQQNSTSVYNVTASDQTPPIFANAQTNYTTVTNGVIKLNITATDNYQVDTVIFGVNDTNYTHSGNDTSNYYYYFDCQTQGSGFYNWNISYANDTFGTLNSTTNEGLPLTFECDVDGPDFTNCQVNETIIGNGELARFSCDISDGVGVDSVNLTIEGTNYTATNISGTWYYDWQCTSSNAEVNLTGSWANDNLGNINTTIITDVSVECDALAPNVENATNNASGKQQLNTIANITCDISDTEGNLNITWLGIDRPVNADTNESMSLLGGNTYNKTLTLNEAGTWNFKCWANDTTGNLNSTSISSSDVAWLNVNLVTPIGTKNVNQNKTFWINASVKCEGDPSIDCGEVNGTARYNASSSDPDTVIPASGTPFYTADLQPQSCGILSGNESCQLNWSVNATGAIDMIWKVDVNFTTNDTVVGDNETGYASVKISAITLTAEYPSLFPASVMENENLTAKGACSCVGTCTSTNITMQFNDGTWKDIPTDTSEELQSNVTQYEIGTLIDTASSNYSFLITGLVGGDYQTRVKCESAEASDTSTERSLSINDYPEFSNFSVNVSLVYNGQYARFNSSIQDEAGISYSNFTIEGVTYDATNGAGNEWYYDWQCTFSNTAVDWTYTGANDTEGYWNDTAISSITIECDANAPSIWNPQINDSTPNLDDWIRINCSINDAEDNLNETWMQVDSPISSAYNTSLTFDTGEIHYHEVQTNELGEWNFTCYANDTGNQVNQTSVFNATVSDQSPPQIQSNAQINVSLIGNNNWAKYNVTITDNVAVDVALFDISGANKTASNLSNEWYYEEQCSVSISGIRNWNKIFANDTASNSASNESTGLSYECDPNAPLAENLTVTPDPVKGGDNVTLRCDVSDSNLDKVWYNITEENNVSEMIFISGNAYEANYTTPTVSGNYTFKCLANDTLGQENSTNITFEVDATSPSITNASLNESGPVLTFTVVKINASVSDSHLDSVFANITRPDGGTDFLEMQNVSGVFELNYSLDTNGTFNFTVFANDTLGNENSTDTSPSSLVVNPRNLTLIVKTDRSLYNRSDTVSVEVNLTSDGTGVENATLEGDANGSINFTYQGGGNYTSSFVASQTQNYTISVNVSKTGYNSVSNQTEIRVDRINITFNIAKTQYSPGETIAVEGNASYESNSSKFPENNITLELLAESKESEVNQTNGQFSTDFLAPNSGGTFYIFANVTGNDSITGTGSFVFTVVAPEPPPPDGGGGGGGIPIEEPPSISINIGRITPGVTNISINKSGLDIIKIQISVSSEANNVYIKIAKIEELPANVIHNVSGIVYQFLEIEHRNLLGLDNVTTYFRVNKTWINENNINVSRIVLQRYTYSGWEVLPTELTGGSDEFAYFSSLSSELSIFAITGQVKTITPSIPEIPVISELEKEIVEKLQQIRVIYQDTLTFIWAAAGFVNITPEEQKLDLIRKFILQIEDAKLQGNFELASNLIKEVEALAVDINTTVTSKLLEQGFIQGVNFALLIIIVLFIILQIEIFFLIKKKRLPRVGLIRFFNHAYRYTARALRKARRKFKLVTARPKIPEKPIKLEIKKAPLKVAKPKERIGWVGFKKKIISKYRTLVSGMKVPEPEKVKPVKKAKIEHEIKMPKLKPPKIKILTRLRKYRTMFKNKLRLLLRPKHPRPKKLEIEWIPAKGKLEIKRIPAKRIEEKKRVKLEIGKALGRYKTRLINKIRLRTARPRIPEKPRELEIKRVSIEAAKPKKEARLLRIEKALGRYKNRLIDKVRLLRITKPEVKKREKIKAIKRKPKKRIGWVEFKKKIISKYRTLVSRIRVTKPEKVKPVKKVKIEHEIKMPIRPVLRKYKTKLVSKTRWVRVRIRKLKRKALKEERHIEKFIKRGETGLMKREKQLKKKIYAEKKPLRIRFKRYRRRLKKFGKALYLKLRKGEKKSKSHEKVLEFEIKKILKTKKNQKGKSKSDKGDD